MSTLRNKVAQGKVSNTGGDLQTKLNQPAMSLSGLLVLQKKTERNYHTMRTYDSVKNLRAYRTGLKEVRHKMQEIKELRLSATLPNVNFLSFNELRRKQMELAKRLENSLGVDRPLVLKLIQYAQMLSTPGTHGLITELVFKYQMCFRFGLTSKHHLQLLYEALIKNATEPGTIHIEDYVKLLCIFDTKNLDRKVDFVFSVYDIDKGGVIEYSELQTLLRNCFIDDSEEEDEIDLETNALKELTELVLNLLDSNRDGVISIEEFKEYTRQNSMYIELLGQVLPSDYVVHGFMESLRRMSDTRIKAYFRDERVRCLHLPSQYAETDRRGSLFSVDLDLVPFT